MILITQELIDDNIIGASLMAAIARSNKTARGIPWMREKPRGYYWSVLHEHVEHGFGYNIERFL